MQLDQEKLLRTVFKVLEIPSPTFQEKKISRFIQGYFPSKDYRILQEGNSFIATPRLDKLNKGIASLPHLALVGHMDVVPEFFAPYRKYGKMYGAGASDMKASLGVFLYLLNHPQLFNSRFRISFIFYAKEEGTPLENNGLYELIQKFPWFKRVDIALVGEPTDNTIQIGCCGSIHARVRISGKASHSARPWYGENALYKAIPFIQRMKQVKPRSYRIGGVVFKDVYQLTVGQTVGGTTTVPGEWIGNVNYRFAPRMNRNEALNHFKKFLTKQGLSLREFEIYSFAPGGKVIATPLYKKVIGYLIKKGMDREAKQAWTDVAQFGGLNIPSFNCGPGLTAQCHTPREYVLEKDIVHYTKILMEFLEKGEY